MAVSCRAHAMTDPTSDARPRVPNARTAAVLGLMGAFAVAVSLGLGLEDRGPEPGATAAILLGAGLYAVMGALAATATRAPFELEDLGAKRKEGSPAWEIGPPLMIGASILVMIEFIAWLTPSPATAAVAIGLAGLVGVFFAAWAYGHHRRHLRFARLVLGARTLGSPPQADAWGVVAGTLVGEGIEREVTFSARSKRVDTHQQTAQGVPKERTQSWIEGSGRTRAPKTMQLRAGEEPITVTTASARWAAPITWAALRPASPVTAKSVARVADGDPVLVVGRVRRDDEGATIRASGPESLLVWGASRSLLLRRTAAWLGPWLALTGLALVSLAAAAHLWSVAPY
jgi:hypothetical protein